MSKILDWLSKFFTALQPVAICVIALSLAISVFQNRSPTPQPAPGPGPAPNPTPVTSALATAVKNYRDGLPVRFAAYRDNITSGMIKTASDLETANAQAGGPVAQAMADATLRHANAQTGQITDPTGFAAELDSVVKALAK